MVRLMALAVSMSVLVTISLLTTVARAAQWECGERSNLTVEGKNYCAAGDFRQSETNLTEVFGALLKKHKAVFDDANALRDAQSAFESYRDSQCAAQNRRIEDQSFYPMVVAQCKTRFTNRRIDELKRMQ